MRGSSDTLAPGVRLGGQYELQCALGEGGMGRVFLATHLGLDRLVAVKCLHAAATAQPDALARFRREARLLGRLSHPNIVVVHDHGIEAGASPQPYIVFEYIRGRTLAERLRAEGPMPRERAVALLRQLAGALAYAHARGVAHRDVKPENVLLIEADGHDAFAKLVDFGLARLFDAPDDTPAEDAHGLTRDLRPLGTPRYMAPEQIRGRPADDRADQYALAVVVTEMLTGHTPFEADTGADYQVAHLSRPPRLPRALRPDLGLPAALDAALERALSKDPAARFDRVDTFAQAVADALGIATGGAPNVVAALPTGACAVLAVQVVAEPRLVTADVYDEIAARLARAVRDAGGTPVGGLTGAACALFPHGADAAGAAGAAVTAGLSALRALVGLAEATGGGLRFGAGLDAGPVLALPGELPVLAGAPVDAALRAAGAAEGTLLVSTSLRPRLRGAFELVPAGAHLAVRGRAPRGRQTERTLAGLPVPMAGRDAERAALVAATPRPGGPGRFVQIVGEAGVGKSRLVAEWLAATAGDAQSPRALVTAARPGPQHADLDPLPEVFRELAHIVPADTPEDAALKAQLLVRRTLADTPDAAATPDAEVALLRFLGLQQDGRTLDPATSAPPVADDGGRAALFGALATLLAQAALRRPLVIVVDDADHLGAAARALLAWLVGRLRLHPVGFVVCARAAVALPPTEAGPVEITLAPLAPTHLHGLAETLSAAVTSPPVGLAAWLEARAGGLPGALEALIDDLVEAGVLHDAGGAWQCTPGATLPAVAASHEARLRARLARLDPRDVRLLSAAALLGGRCFADLLGALTDEPDAGAAVLRLMDLGHLRALREVRCAGGWDFTLADAALGAWLCGQQPPDVARAWHLRAAEWFEQAPLAGFEGRDAAIGHHWLAAGEPRRAAPSLLRAARRACRAFAFEAAIGRFEAALSGLDAAAMDRATVMLELAEQHLLAGHLAEAERLAAEVSAHGGPALGPRAALCRARALERLGRYAEARDTCRAAAPAADAHGPVLALMLRTAEAGAALKLGETAAAAALLATHLDPDVAPGGVELETARSVAWRVLGNASVRGRDLDAAARAYTRSHLLAELVRSPVAIVDARIGLGALAYYRGAPREAQAHWAAALDAAERAGLLQQQAILQNNLGEVTLDLDGPAAARPALERAVALQAALGSDEGRADGHRILAECVLALGEVEAAAQHGALALEAAERTGSPYFRGAAQRALARVAHARAPADPAIAAHLAAAEGHFAAAGLTGEVEETRRLGERLGGVG